MHGNGRPHCLTLFYIALVHIAFLILFLSRDSDPSIINLSLSFRLYAKHAMHPLVIIYSISLSSFFLRGFCSSAFAVHGKPMRGPTTLFLLCFVL